MKNKISINSDELVKCPSCDHEFKLTQGITHQTLEKYESEFNDLVNSERKILEEEIESQLNKRISKQFNNQIEDLMEQLSDSKENNSKIKNQVIAEKEKATAQAREESMLESKILKDEIEVKDKKLSEFREQELMLRNEKTALEQTQKDFDLNLQRQLDEERKQLKSELDDSYRLKESEFQKKISDAQKSNEELKRKLEQGSQQLQGEVLELELEDLLINTFHFDKIDPVGKGVRGADVIHSVFTRSNTLCGKIIWEAKRTENWSKNWIDKLKGDQQAAGAEIAVIVSTVLPENSKDPFLLHDGVWVVRPYAVRPVAELLRTTLIESQRQKVISSGKNENMESLYDYLCSTQFSQKIRSVVDAYTAMRGDLEKEKAAMTRLWKKRETQLEKVTLNMMGMCGELQAHGNNTLIQLEDIGQLLIAED